MKRTIRLTESDLTRIVRRTINEMNEDKNTELTLAMNAVRNYLEETGGTLGVRSPEEIQESLNTLKYAIKLEDNDMTAALQTPNPAWYKKDDMDY